MANKMLIDAAHPEETRVVVLRGNKVEEFDFESANRKQLRGNIYLAKVTRVEPSLQAAFVEYGGNRHGFLAFNEIHPDYYQIPVADRQALIEEEAQAERDAERDEERAARRRSGRGRERRRGGGPAVSAEATSDEAVEGQEAPQENAGETTHEDGSDNASENGHDDNNHANGHDDGEAREEDAVEQVGGSADAADELPDRRSRPLRRQYKIQEVIKRRQVLLVQVVKEERGNKGAALTTYLSLAGRYSVLMPNTARGGGISRKITNAPDRKRLKEVAQELDVPEGMGVILRTAGAARTKAEIKRDFEYLLRLWESVRELTLKSTAPALVYEEGSLIKRAIRDLYNKDIDEVHVAGEEAYREAKDFMRMLMPSHAKAVQPYRDNLPIFVRHGVEAQLDAMFSNQVTLKSGGYIVINPTEALVSIDVNSGRSTREHNIEDTALKTNLEAAEEISRQLRLRDLAGLIVIDFIDMEEKRNNRAVEKKLKDCLKNDRARIQVGRISAFGLMEMSRQRIRTGVLESSSIPCPHCGGSGFVRAIPSVALHILRSIEETLLKSATHNITVKTPTAVALYILNQKRGHLRDLETRFGVLITVVADESLIGATHFAVERGEPAIKPEIRQPVPGIQVDTVIPADEAEDEAESVEDEEESEVADHAPSPAPRQGETEAANGEDGGRRRRRRRRRRGGRGEGRDHGQHPMEAGQSHGMDAHEDGDQSEAGEDVAREGVAREEVAREEVAMDEAAVAGGETVVVSQPAAEAPVEPAVQFEEATPEAAAEPGEKKPRRRRASTGRTTRSRAAASEATAEPEVAADAEAPAAADQAGDDAATAPAPAKKTRTRAPRRSAARSRSDVGETRAETSEAETPDVEPEPTMAEAVPESAEPASTAAPSEAEAPVEATAAESQQEAPAPAQTQEVDNRPKRTGWWSRAKATITGG
ncbi:Rne/Rng family ribonuclease [Chelatococcus sp. GCM10030263]|uniref:Rne/Rng family ribonuclease n=1 Tax=Chelatococcus sp. GCM10030263 TaxID=3273387 RepID=UPI0036066221